MIFAAIARLGVPQRLIGPLLGGVAVLLLGLCVVLWLRTHDAKVIERHEAPIAKQITEATTAANDRANANDAARQAENARADEQLRGAIRDEQSSNPEAARASAGPVTSRAIDELRRRQAKAGAPAGGTR